MDDLAISYTFICQFICGWCHFEISVILIIFYIFNPFRKASEWRIWLICGLFNYAVSSSDHTALALGWCNFFWSDVFWTIQELRIRKWQLFCCLILCYCMFFYGPCPPSVPPYSLRPISFSPHSNLLSSSLSSPPCFIFSFFSSPLTFPSFWPAQFCGKDLESKRKDWLMASTFYARICNPV